MKLEFDYAALAIFFVIIVTIYRKKLIHGRTNRLFIMMVATSIVVTFADFLPFTLFELPLGKVEWHFYTGLFYIYFYLRNATILLYLLFCMSSTRMWYKLHSPVMKFAFGAPYAVLCCVVFSNVFHHRLFTVSPETGYARGEFMPILYIISGLYLIYVIVFLIYCHNRHFLETDKWLALSILVIFTGVAVVLQMIKGDYLVELFSTALAMLSVLLFVQRPEEFVDSVNGVMNYNLYQREVKKVLNTGENAQIFIVTFKNARNVREYLGEQDYDAQIQQILNYIWGFFKGNKYEFDIFYEEPGHIYIVVDNAERKVSPEKIQEFVDTSLSAAAVDERSGLNLDVFIAVASIPDDMADEDSIINFGHKFTQFIPAGRHYLLAEDVVGTDDFHVFNSMDDILKRAIYTGAFEMYYQPIYSLKEGRFISAEALIRLHDPQFGMISPGLFIPEAESRHLMQAIGVHVLHDVIEFIGSEDFLKLGLSYIELNLSGQQCVDKNIVSDIVSYQKKFKVSPAQINLEITETDYEEDKNNLDSNLAELSDAGFALSLDDYGTGYSNMQRILRLPLNIIKIDKTMIDAMDTQKGELLVKNTIRLMQDIGMEIVAEGVEERTQYEKLASMGCDFIQGFYFARPMPRDDFVKFIREKNAGAA